MRLESSLWDREDVKWFERLLPHKGVCVCMREGGGRDRERGRDRQTERPRERSRDGHRETERW